MSEESRETTGNDLDLPAILDRFYHKFDFKLSESKDRTKIFNERWLAGINAQKNRGYSHYTTLCYLKGP